MKTLRVVSCLAVGALLTAGTGTPAPAFDPPIRLRMDPIFARCLGPLVAEFSRTYQIAVVTEIGDPRQAPDTDVLVGDDDDLTPLLEGGVARASLDIGYVAAPAVARDRRPRVAVAVDVAPRRSRSVSLLLGYFASEPVQRAFATCSGEKTPADVLRANVRVSTAGRVPVYVVTVADSWLPACSTERNQYNQPSEVLGPPNAARLGGKDDYRGFMSLGQGGYVTVDMGQTVTNRPGADVRVYQATTGEPVTLYAGDATNGPFTLVGFRRYCGNRSAPGTFSNFCDFDLAEANLSSARYLRVEDGEIYPCLKGSTVSEGADIDAVELLNP